MAVDKILLGEFAANILAAESFEERFKVFEEVVLRLNFEGLTYTFLPHYELAIIAQKKPPLFMKNDAFPDSFIEQHVSDGFFEHDFTIRKINQEFYQPMDWKEHENNGTLNQEEINVIQVAREDHGIINAYTIPVMPKATRMLGISGVSVSSTDNDNHFGHLRENIDTLVDCAQLFHYTCFANMDIHRKFIWRMFTDVSEKKKKMIDALAKGQAVKNIADDFHICPKSAHRIFDEIRNEFGGITRSELIQIAVTARLIDSI